MNEKAKMKEKRKRSIVSRLGEILIEHVSPNGEKVNKVLGFMRSQYDPIDGAWLAMWRFMWGLVMAYEGFTYVVRDHGKLIWLYKIPRVHYSYYWFDYPLFQPPDLIYLKVLAYV